MIYFGWARSNAQAYYMGLDVSLFGFSVQDYVIRSVTTLYLPLLVAIGVGLGWLALHRRVLSILASQEAEGTLRLAGLAALASGLFMAAAALVAAAANRTWQPLVVPLVLAVGIGVAAYGAWLARAVQYGADGAAWQTALRKLLVGAMISLAMFWELSNYADVVGRGQALGIANNIDSQPRATAYSAHPLGIKAPGVHEDKINMGDTVIYRTTGLRLLVQSGGRLFLLHDGWTPQHGTVIVLPDNDQTRWEFSR